ncbi:ATPase domain-containing protein [Massilia litorea]|jgi:circadian clock protein KaiC|uniref:non-specific serine/threonine protein kinase n=1 Tax=Massilia litorea TaxID=2769491 RepID=A0A7L9UBT0_9BURK|nr:ATPase domain-containing protein [Massilia litorea]QOL51576.1 AAA family ATPase [Massilia litorea]
MHADIERIQTGIPELDAVLRGGLIRRRVHLIEGRPGTGKTTLGLRYLIHGASLGEGCLYLTLSESREELLANAHSHGWNLDGIEIEEIMPIAPDTRASQTILLPTDSELSALVARIAERIAHSGARRVVIDSMVEVRLLARDSAHYRRQIIDLRQRLAEFQATVILLDDLTSDGREFELQSAVHGVVTLEQLERSFGATRRRLRVVKLRGGDFQSGWHDYAIKKSEILVFPSLIAQEHHRDDDVLDILSKVDSLDRLVGGALIAGSSTMVVGPSGSGKSTLALQYALSVVESGRQVGYFTFDESEVTLRSRMVEHMHQDDATDEQRLFHLQRVNPSRISPGEFIWNVRRLVEDRGARLIIIDCINSYLDVIREEKSLLLQMNELFSYLSNMNVTSIIVGAHSARLDTSKEPDALSIITDNIISLRYYEHDNVVRKAICMLKRRHGRHEHDVREFHLTDAGIEIGARVAVPVVESGGMPLEF